MEVRRIEVAALLRAGHSKSSIAKLLRVSRMTVHRVSERLNNDDDLKDRPRSGRPRVINSRTVKKAFESDPSLKMSELAKKKRVSVATISRAVKKEGGKSLRCVQRPLLTERMREQRLLRCRRLLNDLKSHSNRLIIFSDEKVFTVDPVLNKQNDRVISFEQGVSKLRCVSTTKHPASVMMLGVVASNGEKMPPVWFEGGYRLTAADYKDILAKKVLPWVSKIAKKTDYVFQQDGAPAHTARVVQEWLSSNMKFWPKDFWPPQSPDLNPLDYSVWAHVEGRACKARHSSVADLKASVSLAWTRMRKDYIRKVCSAFRPRLERVLASEGGHLD